MQLGLNVVKAKLFLFWFLMYLYGVCYGETNNKRFDKINKNDHLEISLC